MNNSRNGFSGKGNGRPRKTGDGDFRENRYVRHPGTSGQPGQSGQSGQKSRCPVSGRCGGCTMIDVPYEMQVQQKQRRIEEMIGGYGRVDPIIRMKNPNHYRNKVTSVFACDRKGRAVSGIYRAGTHEVVSVKHCLLEDLHADRIIQSIFSLLPSFRIRPYNEDTGFGLLRYVQVRCAHATRQIMVTLVTADPVIPSVGKFVEALRKAHPEITTIVQNINDRDTTMVLGDREKILYGPGFIEDILCGRKFRISSRSFYQVNSIQTAKLYNIALDYAGFSGKERILDAYCGIGTIGILAADRCREVLGVELNAEAVKDAEHNAAENGAGNVRIYCNDAGRFMRNMADRGQRLDVLFMDPPRSGASKEFLEAVLMLLPEKIVYISCEPDTLARDLEMLAANGYEMKKAVPVDMFPSTPGIETVCLLSNRKPDTKVNRKGYD